MVNKKTKGIIFSIISAFLYALNVLVLKYFLERVSSNELLFLLYLGSVIGILLIGIVKNKKKVIVKPTKKVIPFIFCIILCDVMSNFLIIEALKYLNASTVSLLSVLETATTIFISFIIFKNRINKNLILSLIFVTLGGILLSINSAIKIDFSFASVLVILATILWGLKNNLTEKISDKNPLLLVFYSCLVIMIFNLLHILKDTNIISLILNNWYLLIIGFFTYGVSILYFVYGTNFLGASKTSIINSLSPLFSTFLSIIIFKDKINFLFILSMFFMSLGIYYTIYDIRKNNSKRLMNKVE